MKEVKLYQCEICGTKYGEKQKAKDCEMCHKIPKEISECRYLSKKQNEEGHPKRITVKFTDGTEADYHRG